eukprot:3077636-Amphidinium_carterae.1
MSVIPLASILFCALLPLRGATSGLAVSPAGVLWARVRFRLTSWTVADFSGGPLLHCSAFTSTLVDELRRASLHVAVLFLVLGSESAQQGT